MDLGTAFTALTHHWLIQMLPLSQSTFIAFLLQSTFFIALILAADRLLKHYDAAAKCLLWTCAILLVPLLTAIANETPTTKVNEYVDELFVGQIGTLPTHPRYQTLTAGSRDRGTGSAQSIVADPGRHGGSQARDSVRNWAVLLYCLTALALLSRIPLGWMRLAQLRKSSVPLDDPRASDLLCDVMRVVRYSGKCTLGQTRQIESPLSFGIARPTILLPSSYCHDLSDTDLRAILLHEITHIRRRDPLRVVLIRLVESVFWFQPFVWIAGRRAEYLSEIVADDAVLETGMDPGTYANVIVNLIEIGAAPKQPLHLAAGIFSAPKMLVARVEALLDLHRAHSTRLERKKLIISYCILLVALAVSLQLSPRGVARAEVASAPSSTDTALAADWVLIPHGTFVMGATDEQKGSFYAFGGSQTWRQWQKPLVESSGPAHVVYLDDYFILRYEVTNQQYRQFLQATGHKPRGISPAGFDGPNQPADIVTWNDARSFCEWAGARLPTEAEWEKAARGPQGFVFPWGNTWDATRLNSADATAGHALPNIDEWESWTKQHLINSSNTTAKTANVGSFPQGASPYGVMDMAGNLWEWVNDWYDPTYYSNSPQNNPKGPTSGDLRVLRGGAFDTPQPVNYTWLRQTFMPPSEGYIVTGFRCAKDAQ